MSVIDTRQFEGLRLHVYKDSVGKSTIGYGHNLQGGNNAHLEALGLDLEDLLSGDTDLTLNQAEALFQLDMADARVAVKRLVPNLDDMPQVVQDILCDLMFNMGVGTLSKFRNTLEAFNNEDWQRASNGLRQSKWYRQVGHRSRVICNTLDNIQVSLL